MKKLIEILCLTASVSFTSLYSQYRYVDLENKFLEPKDSLFLKLPNTLDIKFSVKNLGPDTLYVGDTILYSYLFLKRFPSTFYELRKNIYPGDSVIISETINVTEVPTNETFSGYAALTWGALYPKGRNKSTSPYAPLSLDKDKYENSTDFAPINWYGSLNSIQNSIAKTRAIIYPNPVNQTLYLKADLPISMVCIYGISGTEVKKQTVNGLVTAEISTANLPNGIYVARVQFQNGAWESLRIVKNEK